jgi:arylsulfatase A-like enzyme
MILPTMFFQLTLLLLFGWCSRFSVSAANMLKHEHQPARPNVLVIITDDQGHGDLGFHGNSNIHTPNLDRLARESVRCKYFYVSPVCAPTRASLLTGRYNYRTGVTDTYLGRAMMFGDEVTLGEMFVAAGYRTGLFGKWHLGDNYPMRPMDQGFQESLVHKGGGIAQPSDPPGGDSYFDATLYRNGTALKSKGYCTDVFTDAAIEFIARKPDRPFFAWLAYNAPHTPLQVPKADLDRYHDVSDETTAKVYAMVSNIDGNVGRVLKQLPGNTIVVFLTDNGPQQARYNSGMRDRKGSVYEGGIRVPFFIRWPGKLKAGREVKQVAAHIDLAPTLLDACGIPKPAGVSFDGMSLWPLLTGARVQWPERTLYFQWHRGDVPELHRAFAARGLRFKLVQALGAGEKWDGKKVFQLFDMEKDPAEGRDIARPRPALMKELLAGYERWFESMKSSRGFALPRIVIGTTNENPVTLTRQDWRGPEANWATNGLGYWEVEVAQAGEYDIKLLYPELPRPAFVHLQVQDQPFIANVGPAAVATEFASVPLKVGPARIEPWLQTETAGKRGVHYVVITRRLGKEPH